MNVHAVALQDNCEPHQNTARHVFSHFVGICSDVTV